MNNARALLLFPSFLSILSGTGLGQEKSWGTFTDAGGTSYTLSLGANTTMSGTALDSLTYHSLVTCMRVSSSAGDVRDLAKGLQLATLFNSYLRVNTYDYIATQNLAIRYDEMQTSGTFADPPNGNYFFIRLPYGDGVADINNSIILTGSALSAGLQQPKKRRNLWAKIFLSSIIQSEIIAEEIRGNNNDFYQHYITAKTTEYLQTLKNATDVADVSTAFADDLLKGVDIVARHSDGLSPELATFLKDLSAKANDEDGAFATNVMRLHAAITAIDVGALISSDIMKTLLYKTLQTAEADRRLALLTAWMQSASPGFNDSEIANGFAEAQQEYLLIRDNTFSAITGAILKDKTLLTTTVTALFEEISTQVATKVLASGTTMCFANGIIASVTAFANLMTDIDDKYDVLRLASLSATLEYYLGNYVHGHYTAINPIEGETLDKLTYCEMNYFLGYYYFMSMRQVYDNTWYTSLFYLDLLNDWLSGVSQTQLMSYCDTGISRNIDKYNQFSDPYFCSSPEVNWFSILLNNYLQNGLGQITAQLDQPSYAPSQSATITVQSSKSLIGATVTFTLNGTQYTCTDTGNGIFLRTLAVPAIPNVYTLTVTAGKSGYPSTTTVLALEVIQRSAGTIVLTLSPNPGNIDQLVTVTATTQKSNYPIDFSTSDNTMGHFLSSMPVMTNASGVATTNYYPSAIGNETITAYDDNDHYNYDQKILRVAQPIIALQIELSASRVGIENGQVKYSINTRVMQNDAPFGNSYAATFTTTFGTWSDNGQQTVVKNWQSFQNKVYLLLGSDGTANVTVEIEGNHAGINVPIKYAIPPLTSFRTIAVAGISSLSFSPEGRRIVYCSTSDKYVRMYDLAQGAITAEWLIPYPGGSNDIDPKLVRFAPDGSRIFIGGNRGSQIIDTLGNALAAGNASMRFGSAVAGDAKWVSNSLLLVNFYESSSSTYKTCTVNSPLLSVATTLSSGTAYYKFSAIDVANGYGVVSYQKLSDNEGHALGYSTGSWSQLWNFNPTGSGGQCNAVSISPDGSLCAVSDTYGTDQIYILSASSGSVNGTSLSDGSDVRHLAWNPVHIQYLAAMSTTLGMTIWDVSSRTAWKTVPTFNISDGDEGFWSPSGDMLAVASGGQISLFAPFDENPPSITTASPLDNFSTTQSSVSLNGSVSDDSGVQSAHYRVNGGAWIDLTLTGTSRQFTTKVDLPLGAVTIEVEAFDIYGKNTVRTIVGGRELLVAPAKVVLMAPPNTAADQLLPLTLSWRPVPTATAYHLQLARDSLFVSMVLDDSSFTSSDTARFVTWLERGRTFFWRVCGISAAGPGTFSSTWRFTVSPNPPRVLVRAFLEGPFSTETLALNNGLNLGGQLLTRFTGRAIPVEAVDSVCVEVRDSATASKATMRTYASAWLLTDGSLKTFADTTKGFVEFNGLTPGNYYIVMRHRNHLAIMSKVPVALSATSPLYDFTTGQDKAWGTNPMKQLAVGVFGLLAGDANGTGDVTILDRAAWRTQNSLTGYLGADFNLSGDVSILDRAIWRLNNSLVSQVP
jgi:hypothetical protein